MRTRNFVFLPALFAALALPAVAKTTVISNAQMGSGQLLGQSASSAGLKTNIAQRQALFQQAAMKLGVSASEYASLRQQIAASRYSWVTVPRHLDAMSWASHQRVHVIRDVMIPAGINGWEVDVRQNNQILALFMPAICGNLSLIRKNMPVVAKVAPAKTVAKVAPPPAPVPVGAPPQVLGVETAPAPPADTVVTAAAVHHVSLLPLLLGIIPFIAGGGGGSTSHGSSPPPPPIICGCH